MKKPILILTKKDFRVDALTGKGKGGQNVNRLYTGCRITHIESGISSECRETRSFHQNKATAFRRLAEKLRPWLREQVFYREEIERKVEEQMKPKNIKVEVRDGDGKWITEDKIEE